MASTKAASTKVHRVNQSSKARKKYDALARVKEFYPNVVNVTDADESLMIEVTPKDCTSKAVKNHRECAMAVAVKRTQDADGAIISKSVAYVIKGTQAIRFKVGNSVAREVVSFDRKGGFEPGTYALRRPCKGEVLGTESKQKKYEDTGNKPRTKTTFHHITTNVRTRIGAAGVA